MSSLSLQAPGEQAAGETPFEDEPIERSDPLAPPPKKRDDGHDDNNKESSSNPVASTQECLENHQLQSYKAGDSEVEQMAHSIWARRQHRYNVTKPVRLRLLKSCRQIAIERGYEKRNRIHYSDLLKLREDVSKEVKKRRDTASNRVGWLGLVGLKPESELLLDVIDKAILLMQSNQLHSENDDDENEFFHYEEFVFDHVHAVSKYPWMRPGLHRPITGIFMFYLLTPVWFCHILVDDQVCVKGDNNSTGTGWVASLYFASKTLSTVGYGDLSVNTDSDLKMFVGVVYMILSNFVLVVCFSSAVDQTFQRFKRFNDRIIDRFLRHGRDEADEGPHPIDDDSVAAQWEEEKHSKHKQQHNDSDSEASGDLFASQKFTEETHEQTVRKKSRRKKHEGDFLHKRINRLRMAMLLQLTLQYIALNMLGVLVLRLHLYLQRNEEDSDDPEIQWNWMTTAYWAVQTTTTIGYGDLAIGTDLRWFQIFYLIISTYFLGNALTGFATLQQQIDEIRRRAAWQRREVSKAMIDEMQGFDHDDKIDQFEFTIASLLQLGKINEEDTRIIMNKYRELCNEDGFIQFTEPKRKEDEDNVDSYYEDFNESSFGASLMRGIGQGLGALRGGNRSDASKSDGGSGPFNIS